MVRVLTPEDILAELDEVIRTMPPRPSIRHETPENLAWFGRAAAAITKWDPIRAALQFQSALDKINHPMANIAGDVVRTVIVMLHQARSELALQTVGPMAVAVGQGQRYEYFEKLREIIEAAKSDLFFVDPYLDAEFAARYLPQVTAGVTVRLMGRERIASLLPAVALQAPQLGLTVEVRAAAGFHDRYVFVDRQACYQSGASFKDGAKSAPTVLSQITDAFAVMLADYEARWAGAAVHR